MKIKYNFLKSDAWSWGWSAKIAPSILLKKKKKKKKKQQQQQQKTNKNHIGERKKAEKMASFYEKLTLVIIVYALRQCRPYRIGERHGNDPLLIHNASLTL